MANMKIPTVTGRAAAGKVTVRAVEGGLSNMCWLGGAPRFFRSSSRLKFKGESDTFKIYVPQ